MGGNKPLPYKGRGGFQMNRFKTGAFWNAAITLAVVYGIVKWVIPLLSRTVTGLPFPLSVPGTLMLFYITLTVFALYIFITSSDERVEEFKTPIKKLLLDEYGKRTRTVVLVALPLIFGWQVYSAAAPKISSPTSLRVQHPSSGFPKEMETLENPFGNPSDAEVEKFVEEVKAGSVTFIPEALEEVEKVRDKYDSIIGFIPTEAVQAFLKDVKEGKADKERARKALIEKYLFEGRILYARNCRPCHGDSAAGDGAMADGFRLRPINFTDNGTIETIVEGYTFWRVANGGPGLPKEATPWDSAMPEWKGDLSDDYRWRIILAEYDLAQKTPRQPEKHAEEGGKK